MTFFILGLLIFIQLLVLVVISYRVGYFKASKEINNLWREFHFTTMDYYEKYYENLFMEYQNYIENGSFVENYNEDSDFDA